MTRVMIASPTPGSVKTGYMKAVMATMNSLGRANIYAEWDTVDGASADPTVSRNILATRFYRKKPAFTHLFALDADQIVPGDLCEQMIACDKPIVGTGIAKKQLDFARVEWALKNGCTLQEAMLIGFDWVVSMPSGLKQIEIDNGLIAGPTRHGFGAVLIKREVIATMVDKGIAKPQKPLPGQAETEFYNFFTARPSDDGQHCSEDRSFLARWTEDCGGKLWIFAPPEILHIGEFGFGGSYLQYLQALTKAVTNEAEGSANNLRRRQE